jgi:hypothetical protein
MTNDIVDELEHAALADKNPWDNTLYLRAAEEIKRLRSLLSFSNEITQPNLPISAIVIRAENGEEYQLKKE